MIAKYIFQEVLETELDKQLKFGSRFQGCILSSYLPTIGRAKLIHILKFRICGKREAWHTGVKSLPGSPPKPPDCQKNISAFSNVTIVNTVGFL